MTDRSRSAWPIALASTLLIQIAVSFLSQAMSVLAPSLTEAANVSPEQIGWLAAAVAFGTVWFLMGGTQMLTDIGPIRLLQIGVLVSSFGLLLALLGFWPVTMLAALLVGLGYGPAPPAGNQILMNTVPKEHRGLIFSIKQSGAPIGSALAGFLLPVLANQLGWAWALGIAAVLGGASAFLVEPVRLQLDAQQARFKWSTVGSLFSPQMVTAPFRALQGSSGLKQLAYAGFAFAVVQGSIFALFVTYLVTDLGANLSAAGAAFATMQLAGAAARIAMGWLADRTSSPLLVIAALGIASSVTMTSMSAMQLSWGWHIILAISALTGFCAASWNGILMSEIAKASPANSVGQTTSAATFFIFIGYVLGPAVFAGIVRVTASYQVGFSFLELFPITGSVTLYLLYRRMRRARS